MSVAPADLARLAAYLRTQGAPVLGIVGDAAHTGGYHLGRDRIPLERRDGKPPDDYSVRQTRDRLGLTIEASAIDIGRHPRLPGLFAYLWDACRDAAPGSRDIRELILEGHDGATLWRFDTVTGLSSGALPLLPRIHHGHVSYYRDSRSRDKVPLIAAYYEGDTMPRLYGAQGRARTFPAGTPVYDAPGGKQTSTLKDPTVVYRIAAQDRDATAWKDEPGWWLLDGGGDGGMGWVKGS